MYSAASSSRCASYFFVELRVQLPSQEQRANPRQQHPHQSFRSAATGLRRIARLAGIAEAIAVTTDQEQHRADERGVVHAPDSNEDSRAAAD